MKASQLLRNGLVVVVCLALVGCTTLRRVDVADPQALFRPGDQLTLITKGNATIKMTVSGVTALAVEGAEHQGGGAVAVNFSDIASVERKERDAAKTTLLVVLLLIGAVFFLKALAASQVLGSA